MRDTTLGNNAKQTSTPVAPAPLRSRLSQEEKLRAHIRLIQALQQTLDPEQVLQAFFHHLQPLITTASVSFAFSDLRAEVLCGRQAIHHCDYRLTIGNDYLGKITFSRNKRFSEEEMALLESLLAALIYPLRNALNYEAALRLTLLDPLTSLGNRAAMDTALCRELQLAERHQQELSLLMVDIDHFKQINDVYGHSRGDDILRAVAKTIQAACRTSDLSFRYGGEEFVVLLPSTGATGARTIAERIREQISQLVLGQGSDIIRPTVSIGISTRAAGKREHVRDLFERADQALYRAKTKGRNCTVDLAS